MNRYQKKGDKKWVLYLVSSLISIGFHIIYTTVRGIYVAHFFPLQEYIKIQHVKDTDRSNKNAALSPNVFMI